MAPTHAFDSYSLEQAMINIWILLAAPPFKLAVGMCAMCSLLC